MNPIATVMQALATNPTSLGQQILSTVLRVNNFNITLMSDVSTPPYTIPAMGGSILLSSGEGDFTVGIGLSQPAAGPLNLNGLVAVCLNSAKFICVHGAERCIITSLSGLPALVLWLWLESEQYQVVLV
jgi:hypothetical protein